MKREKKVKYALVLSGGGFNGAFQLGALNYINKHWKSITGLSTPMKFDLIAGVSVGAINGAMVASNQMELLNELWLEKIAKNGVSEIYTSDFIDTAHKGDNLKIKLDLKAIQKKLIPKFSIKLKVWDKLKLLFSKKKRKEIIQTVLNDLSAEIKVNLTKLKALGDNTPLKQKLQKYLHKDKINTTKFMCGFVSLDDGKYKSVLHSDFTSNKDFINGVVASACIPMVYSPVKRISYKANRKPQRSLNNIDGGVNNVSPLGDVVKHINNDPQHEYKIIIINCHSGAHIPKDYSDKNIAQIASRSLYDIAFTEIFNNDVKHFLKINDLVKQAKAWSKDIVLFDNGTKQIKAFDATVIQPNGDFDLGNGLVANERLIHLRLSHGESMAEQILTKK